MSNKDVDSAPLHLPQVRSDLPTEWSWSRLDRLCLGVFDCPHSTPKLTETGPFAVRTQDIASGVFRTEAAAHVSEETYLERTSRVVPSLGDLLYSREGTYFGVAAEVPADTRLCLGQRMVLIRPDNRRVSVRYLRFWLNSPVMASYIEGYRDGSVAQRLNLPTIRALPVLLPSMAEQCGMADILGALDDKFEANRKTADKAEELARTIPMSQAVTVAVGSIAMVRRNLVSTAFFANREVEYFSIPAYDAHRLPAVESGDDIKSGKFLLEEPTVLISKLNPRIPRVWMAVPTGTSPAIGSTEFIGLVPTGVHPIEVIWALCSSVDFSSQLSEMVKGTTGSHQRVATEDVLAIEVPDPSSLSDSAITTIITAVRLARSLRLESERISALRDTLLPNLVCGEIRIRDAETVIEGAI